VYRYQSSRQGRVAPLAIRADGSVVQLSGEVLPDWPIRYIMTFVALRSTVRALFGTRR
jgi:hypothetical protein